jgi:parallel beta-helix repeat protein
VNPESGVSVCDAGTRAIIKNNTISKNGLVGVYVFDEAAAVVEVQNLDPTLQPKP